LPSPLYLMLSLYLSSHFHFCEYSGFAPTAKSGGIMPKFKVNSHTLKE
jgi:hypothetical protein